MAFNTLFIGQNLIELTSIDSSNNYALNLVKAGRPAGQAGNIAEGTLIWAHEQTAGRGQRGNEWLSKPLQNLTFSLVLIPRFLAPGEQFLLTKMVSLAIADFVADVLGKHDITAEVRIKWPNDVYVNDHKIAGVLIENTIKQEEISYSVIGIGLNVNQIEFGNSMKAISLKQLTGKDHNLRELLSAFCSNFEARYLQLKAGKKEILNANYLHKLYRLNEVKEYKDLNSGKKFTGKILGVTSTGKLHLEINEVGREFDLKEIEFI